MADLHKHTLNLNRGDYDRLRDLHPTLAPSQVIRALIRAHIKKAESARQQVVEENVDVDL